MMNEYRKWIGSRRLRNEMGVLKTQRDELLAVGQKLCREVERTNEIGRMIRMLDSALADSIDEMCAVITKVTLDT